MASYLRDSSKYNRKVCVINILSDELPKGDSKNILITSQQLSMCEKGAHPPEIEEWLRKVKYPFQFPLRLSQKGAGSTKTIFEILGKEFYVVNELLQKEWDFFMYTNLLPDLLQHHFWKYTDRNHPLFIPSKNENIIPSCYQFIDQFLDRLLQRVEQEKFNLFILSDHGFGPLYKRVDLNSWLRREGFLKLKTEKRRKLTRRKVVEILRNLRLERVFLILKRTPWTNTIINRVTNKIPIAERLIEDVDFEKTKAYCITFNGIHINLRGREPQGTVMPGKEYEKVRDEIIERLYKLRDPETGMRVIDRVFKKEDVYSGQDIQNIRAFPDITIKFNDESKYIAGESEGIKDKIFSLPNISGNHTGSGILLAYGPDIKEGCNIRKAKIYDIAPTILHILGVPIPEDVDGRVLREIFAPSSDLIRREVTYQKVKEREILKEKIKKLKSLGRI